MSPLKTETQQQVLPRTAVPCCKYVQFMSFKPISQVKLVIRALGRHPATVEVSPIDA
jgi:hypothetical protein